MSAVALEPKFPSYLYLDNTISGLEDGIVTGASEKGTWVRLFHPPVDGKLIRGFEGLDVGH